MATAAPDAIVNLAGLSHVGESWKRMGDYFRANVLGDRERARRRGGPAGGDRLERRGLRHGAGGASSRSPRTAASTPQTPYALTKAAAERLALARGAVVARSFNLIGPGQAPKFALASFASQLAAIAPGRAASRCSGRQSLRRGAISSTSTTVPPPTACWRRRGAAAASTTSPAAGRSRCARPSTACCDIAGVAARRRRWIRALPRGRHPLLSGDAGRLRALGWEPRRTLDDALPSLCEAAVR